MSTLTDNQNLLFQKHKEYLTKMLKELVDKLKHEGLLPNLSKEDETKLIHTVANKILGANPKVMDNMQEKVQLLLDAKQSNENKKVADIHLRTFFNSLQVCLLSERLKMADPKFKFDYEKLFTPKHTLTDPQKEFKKTLTFLFTLMNMKQNEKLNEKELDASAEKEANDSVNDFMKKNNQVSMSQNNRINNTLLECAAQAIRSLFGVAKPGEVQRPIPIVLGNVRGYSNLQGASDDDKTFMAGQNRFDNTSDPYGIEHAVLANDISYGFVNAIKTNTSHEATETLHKSPTPFQTTPKPPGTVK